MAGTPIRKLKRQQLCVSTLVFAVLLTVSSAHASDFQKSTTGRLPPPMAGVSAGSRLEVEFGSGMMAGGDLFSYKSPNLMTWFSQAGVALSARKFTVTLDENALLYFGAKFRVSRGLAIRLNFERTEMTAIAQAFRENEVVLLEFDVLAVSDYCIDLTYELGAAAFRPFLSAGLTYVVLDGEHVAFSESLLGPRFGAGASYRIMKSTRLVGEVTVSRVDIDTQGIMGENLPLQVEYENYGPHQIYALKLYVSFRI